MANKLYPKFKQALLSPGLNLSTATVKAVLVDTGAYTQSDTHEFLSSVPSGARYGTPQALTSKTVTNGTFDAADTDFPAITAGTGTGTAVEAIVVYVEGSDDTSSRLVAYIDTATGLPLTLNGSSAKITWDANGIFSL